MLAPALLLADLAVRVLNLALAGLARVDDVIDANAERALLGVAEGDRTDAPMHIDCHNDEPRFAQVEDMNEALLLHDLDVFGGFPVVAWDDNGPAVCHDANRPATDL